MWVVATKSRSQQIRMKNDEDVFSKDLLNIQGEKRQSFHIYGSCRPVTLKRIVGTWDVGHPSFGDHRIGMVWTYPSLAHHMVFITTQLPRQIRTEIPTSATGSWKLSPLLMPSPSRGFSGGKWDDLRIERYIMVHPILDADGMTILMTIKTIGMISFSAQ